MQKFVIDIQELKVAVDIVVLSKQNDTTYVLLIKRKYAPFEAKWALPGGFVKNDEDLDEAAIRELKEESGFETFTAIEQIKTFGKVDRDPRRRVISIAYLIVSEELPTLHPEEDASNDTNDAKWFKLNEIPYPLAFDHEEILKKALEKFDSIN
jgi:8-oxo-dGTP diphosphatase